MGERITGQDIERIPQGWKRFCLEYLRRKGWHIERHGSKRGSTFEIWEPDSGGVYTVHRMQSCHSWETPSFIKMMGWQIARKDLVTPALDQIKDYLQALEEGK